MDPKGTTTTEGNGNVAVADQAAETGKGKGKGKGGKKLGDKITPSALAGGAQPAATTEAPAAAEGGKGKGKKGNAKGQTAIQKVVATPVEDKPLVTPDKINPEYASQFLGIFKRTTGGVLEMAQIANKVRDEYGYKSFAGWLEDKIGMSRQTGDNLLRVHDNLLQSGEYTIEQLSKLDPTGLYRLAANNVPANLRKRLISKAATLDRPTTAAQIEDAIAAFKSAQEKAAEKAAAAERAKNDAAQDKITGATPPLSGGGAEQAAPADAQQAASNQPPAVSNVDELGQEIPESDEELTETFLRATEIDDQVKKVEEVLKRIERGGASTDPLFTFINTTAVKNAGHNLINELKHTRPYALCPKHGQDKISRDRCEWCKGTGWLPKQQYEAAKASMDAGNGKDASSKEADSGKETAGAAKK